MLKHLPNALTLARLILAPVVAWAVWQAYATPAETAAAQTWSLAGAALFILAALTDLLDGMAARALKAHSKFGRLIDPIADKALVGLPLIAISIVAMRSAWPLWQAIALSTLVIVSRDILITSLRFTAKDGEGVRVSRLAKWKTAVELFAVAVAVLIAAAPALAKLAGLSEDFVAPVAVTYAWIVLLGFAALLSAVTALQYLTPKSA
jgi:cardiolipin synthase (CMP-forming)